MAERAAEALQLAVLPIARHKKGYAEDAPSTAGMWAILCQASNPGLTMGQQDCLLPPTEARPHGLEYLL